MRTMLHRLWLLWNGVSHVECGRDVPDQARRNCGIC